MLIGLNGQIGSGKDTVYQRLLENADCHVSRIAFADKMKQSVAATLNITDDAVELDKIIDWVNRIKESGQFQLRVGNTVFDFSGREFLQWYGTEAHRNVFGEDFWVDAALPPDFYHYGEIVCVTDVRFLNEAQRIHDLGGQVWRVLNGPLTPSRHRSEQILPLEVIDVEIANHVRDDNYAHLDGQIKAALDRPLFSKTWN